MLTDKEILQLIKQPGQENRGFESLVRKYKSRIYWHIRRMVIDHDDADDVTQITFIKIWQGISNFRGDSSLYSWIYRIATNETLTFLKGKKRRQAMSIDEDEALQDKLQACLSPDCDEVERKLQRAIVKLPEKQRLVFNLRYYDEMPYDEMSSVLGTSVGALKASYHLAVKKVEKSLNPD
jgi:RNA polymerase sigma-70 factor (ECF subfamily)